MKDFLISIYDTLGITGIIFVITAIILIIIECVNSRRLRDVKEENRGIQNELQYLRQDQALKEQGKGYYR